MKTTKNFKTFRKNILTITMFILFCGFINAQNKLDNFFKYEGAKLLSQMAHPLTDYDEITYWIGNNYAYVNMEVGYYKTKLKIYWNNSIFYRIDVDENDVFRAFGGIEVIKDLLLEASKNDKESVSIIERKMGKYLKDMNGSELACVVFTLAWYAY